MITLPAIISHIEYSASWEVTFVRCKPQGEFTFAEGQFMMITADHVHAEIGKPLKKPYSIATTNVELQRDGTIGFIVKKVREGFMSDYLTTRIAVGDTLHLQWPLGHMYIKQPTSAYLLISVGSGLSPMVGLYNAIRTQQPDAYIANIFGERYLSHVPASVQEIMGGQTDAHIHHTLCLSRQHEIEPDFFAHASTYMQQWYVQDAVTTTLASLMTTHKISDVSVFLCGKPEMVDSVKGMLEDMGFEKGQVQFEKY